MIRVTSSGIQAVLIGYTGCTYWAYRLYLYGIQAVPLPTLTSSFKLKEQNNVLLV